MKVYLLPLPILAALMVAGCGSGGASKLAASDVATVSTQHVTLEQFDSAISQAKASAKASGQAFPAAGSTDYATLKTQIMDGLVQQAEFDLEAVKLGIVVTDKEVQAQVDTIKKKYFKNSQTKYLAGLKQQGYTDADLRASLKERLLEQKLYKQVTKGAKATAAQVAAYYQVNISQYEVPASRDVEEILVGKNKETLAQQIYTQVKGGADFAALAKKYSQDPGSKNIGGKFTAKQGSDVAEFDKAVFATTAKTKVVLPPVKTAQYGWFVIEPLADIVPASTTPEKTAAKSIQTTLDQQQQQKAASDWADGVAKTYCSGGKIKYQVGYAPSPDPCDAIATKVTTT